jgi:ubiquinone/menaquinone biosynthesis C-methylase UbiE
MNAFYDRHIMPRLIGCACATKPIMKQRAKIVPQAAGDVLELGMGGGLNLAFYDPRKVVRVTGVDPSEALRARALKAPRPDGLDVRMEAGVGEALPFEDQRFDCVICTFTLCSVESPTEVLAEAKRVLKPGGRFLFCEHGLSPDVGIAVWQRRIEPLWKMIAGDCHLTRPVAETLRRGGLTLDKVETMSLPNSPRIAAWNEWGVGHFA